MWSFNLDPTKPLFSFIGRLLEEKGGDLLPQASELASENFQQINILILGSEMKVMKISWMAYYQIIKEITTFIIVQWRIST
jgi:glycogen synthase